MFIVLSDGPDVRFLGGHARARNARVALRAGATVQPLAALTDEHAGTAVLVPWRSALMLPLFSDPVFIAATRLASPVWLDAEAGASVLVGPAALVAACVAEPARLSGLPRQSVARGTILNIGTPADRRRATRAALLATEKPSDGWVSRTVNRPVSRACSRVALTLGMSANMASLITLAVGLGCASIAAQPGHLPLVVMGLLFQLASILDGVDGEIARATLTESETGARVDTLVDQSTYLVCFAGLTIGWAREGSGWLAITTTAAIGLALWLTMRRGARFVARYGENASFVLIDRSVRRAARDTRQVPLRVAAAFFALLRRDVFAVIFLAVSLTGIRSLFPALILAGLAIANVTLSVYSGELADAAGAERASAPVGAVMT